ncbi:hypothetical protein [Halorubrum ezzemoulense]|uniref:hypothetical protein n=1 Tax=Halorubrum ezzemoulense TaxID=337243 RepID=UPI00232BDE9A|nr:hypothetical protein [Halorubrum ezzemoulense]MDB2240947.1 hypothetical protein [Halorubrum ezzemoulense]
MSANWQNDGTPEYDEINTISIPSEDAVRDVTGNARCLDIENERVTAATQGLVPPNVALHDLLFNPEPTRPEIIEGTIVVYLAETLHIEGRPDDGAMRATIRADVETHEIQSVELTAEIA